MKTLLLLRHAKSSRKEGVEDYDRPLSSRGKKDARRIGRLLAEEGLLPDWIVSSSAKRCRRTTERVVSRSGWRGETHLTPGLYMADVEHIVQVLAGLPAAVERALLVGHNPGLEQLLVAWCGNSTPLPPAGLVQVELPVESWSELTVSTAGRIVAQWTDKGCPQ